MITECPIKMQRMRMFWFLIPHLNDLKPIFICEIDEIRHNILHFQSGRLKISYHEETLGYQTIIYRADYKNKK